MVIEQAILDATQRLKAAEIENPRLEANVLLQAVLHTDRIRILRMQNQELDAKTQMQYIDFVSRRIAGEPTAYILGIKEFMSLEFAVSPAVLIPRPDTEILCEAVLERAKVYNHPQILDLCCGSGCIGISLAHFMPQSRVTLIDKSEAAVAVAKQNAATLAPDNTSVQTGDAFALEGVYDIIVSNPPYIETNQMATLQPEVRMHEPHMALDGGEDGLVFYLHFARKFRQSLKAGGFLALEVGHTQAQTVRDLLVENGWKSCEIIKDLAGIERVVLGYK